MLEGINLESTYGNEISSLHLQGHGIVLQCRIFKNEEYVSFLSTDKVLRIARGGSFNLECRENHWQSFLIKGMYIARIEKSGFVDGRILIRKFHLLSRILSNHISKH